MCTEFKYLETLEFSNHAINGFACEHSEDGRIFIITDTGIYILQLCLKPENVTPSICFKKFYVPVDKYVFGLNLGIDPNHFAKDLNRLQFYELALSIDLSPKLFMYNEIEPKISMAKWSSSFLDGPNCVLGVLTNLGSLQIYVRTLSYTLVENYISICNISAYIINLYKMTWANSRYLVSSEIFTELKERAQVKPTALSWSKLFKEDNESYSLLAVGHMNKNVTVWRFSIEELEGNKEAKVKCLLKIDTELRHITTLYFHNTNDRGLILAGDYHGNITAIPLIYITKKEIKLGEQMSLWMSKDQVSVINFCILLHERFIYIVCVKSDSLLLYLLNKRGDILDNCTFQVGNLDITGIEKINENTLLVQTITGLMKEIVLTTKSNQLEISWRHIYVNVNWSLKRAHGLFFSHNKVLFGLLTNPCSLKLKKEDKHLVNLILFENACHDPLKLILTNNSNSLFNYWDCFEVIRVTTLLTKQSPINKLPKNENKMPFITIKTYMHILKICENVYEDISDDTSIKSYESFRCLCKITFIIYRMKYLLDLQHKKKITEFQLQNLFVLNNYLKEFVLQDMNMNLIETFRLSDKVKEVLLASNDLEYPEMPKCLVCNDSIIDSNCLPPHYENRCAITMMPLEYNSAFKCSFCKCRAHTKLKEEVKFLLCPYCDNVMDLCTAELNIKGDASYS